MAVGLRASQVSYGPGDVSAPVVLATPPLASSVLVMLSSLRQFTSDSVPSPLNGWTSLLNQVAGAERIRVWLRSAAGITELPGMSGSGGGNVPTVLHEIQDGDINAVSIAVAVNGASPSVLGPGIPVRPTGPAVALGLAVGYSGDPAAGCYWTPPALWTALQCGCQTPGSGFHPWWGTFQRTFPVAAGASIAASATNSIGQANLGIMVVVNEAAPARTFAGEPGGGVW